MAILPLVGIAGALLLTVGWAVDEIGLPGYDPSRESISALGAVTVPRAWVWNAMVSLSGVCVIGFAVLVHRSLPRHLATRLGTALLVVWGVGFLIDGFVRLDDTRLPSLSVAFRDGSWHQRAHIIESVIDISALTMAPFVFAFLFRGVDGWQRLGNFSLVAGAAVAVGDCWFLLSDGGATPGIGERLLISAAALWMAVVCVGLRRAGTARAGSFNDRRRDRSPARGAAGTG